MSTRNHKISHCDQCQHLLRTSLNHRGKLRIWYGTGATGKTFLSNLITPPELVEFLSSLSEMSTPPSRKLHVVDGVSDIDAEITLFQNQPDEIKSHLLCVLITNTLPTNSNDLPDNVELYEFTHKFS